MKNPNTGNIVQLKFDQEKLYALIKLIQETKYGNTDDWVKLKEKRDKLNKMVKDIERTTTTASQRIIWETKQDAKILIKRIDDILNTAGKDTSLRLGNIASGINEVLDIVNQVPGNQTWLLAPVANKALNAIIQGINKGILAISPAANTALAAANPLGILVTASALYLEILNMVAEHMKKSLMYKIRSSRGGEKGPDTPELEKAKLVPTEEELRTWAKEQFEQMYKDGVFTYVPYGGDPNRPLSIDLKPYIDAGLFQKIIEDFPYSEILDYYNQELDEFLKNRSPHDSYGVDQTIPHTIDHEPLLKAIAANAANAAAQQSPGYAQAATRDRLMENRERREYEERIIQKLLPALQAECKQYQDAMEKYDALRERKANQAEQGAVPSPACMPRPGAEYIAPMSYPRDARNSSPQEEKPKYRFAGQFSAISPAAVAAMAAQSAAERQAASAPQGGVKVIIEKIHQPPTHLADEDFRRYMQREIDQIVNNFDSGVRG